MSEATLPPEALDAFNRRVYLCATALHLLVVFETWHRGGSVALALAAALALTLANIAVTKLPERLGHVEWVELGRALFNGALLAAVGHLLDWPLAIWLWVPFAAVFGSMHGWAGRALQAIWLGSLAGVGLYDGVPWTVPLAFAVLQSVLYLLTEGRVQLARTTAERLSQVQQLLLEREAQNAALLEAQAELKAVHQRALAQEKLSSLGMMAAGVAHEINNPMAYVTSNVSSMLSELKAAPALEPWLVEYRDELLPATMEGVRRVNAIVADLRRFARGDPNSMVEYDLNDEIRAAARILQARFRTGCELQLDLQQLPPLVGNPQQLSQVMVNLMVNAAQATAGRGKVVVQTRFDGDRVLTRVQDNGSGMDEATLKKLFQPFFTTKPVGEGTGLGLSVSWGIVKEHGGNISATSAPGRGSTFTVELPILPSLVTSKAAAQPVARMARAG